MISRSTSRRGFDCEDHSPWNQGEFAPANCRGFEAEELDGKRRSLAGARTWPVVACARTTEAKASLENVDIVAAFLNIGRAGRVPKQCAGLSSKSPI
jgi:hypothetical protein